MEKKCIINIPVDQMNKDAGEQFKLYQRDGVTIEVPIGMNVEVPMWLAERAKEIGDITDYFVKE